MSRILAFSDEEWEFYKSELKRKLKELAIPHDAHPRMVMNLLSAIDILFSEIRLDMAELVGAKETFGSLIRETERQYAVGKNESDRKRNATKAVQEFPISENQTANLYDIHRQVCERLAFIEGVIDTLQERKSSLIIVNGMLKLEQSLLPYSGGMNIPQMVRGYSYDTSHMG